LQLAAKCEGGMGFVPIPPFYLPAFLFVPTELYFIFAQLFEIE